VEATKQHAEDVIDANQAMLADLRRLVAGFFSRGKTDTRRKAREITILDAPGSPGEPDGKLVIHPSRPLWRGAKVDPDAVMLNLFHDVPRSGWQSRILMELKADGSVFVLRCWPDALDLDAARACSVAARFVLDPLAAIAANGVHCA
jgi:hypothetical protein